MLEVFYTCPSQWNTLFSSLGIVDPFDDHLIIFDVDNAKHPPIPSSIAFQIPISIKNAMVQQCIIDEGASTFVMAASIWKKLISHDLSPSTITLRAWDGHPLHPLGLYHNCPIIVACKVFLIDIEVIYASLYYNILLGHSCTYAMYVVASVVFFKMHFPHNINISIVDQLTYYDPQS